MNRTEALDQAAAFIERIGGLSFRTDAYARAHAVLDVAEFLLGATEEAEASEGYDYLDPDGARVPRGPARQVPCSMTPGDHAYTRSGHVNGVPFVAVVVKADNQSVSVMLAPREARAYAAGLLDCADEADGASPAVWDLLRKGKGDDDDSAPTPANV